MTARDRSTTLLVAALTCAAGCATDFAGGRTSLPVSHWQSALAYTTTTSSAADLPRQGAQGQATSPRPPLGRPPDERLRVRQVIDGDTITVSGIGTVRLLGVDAPEKTGGYRGAEPYGDQATRFMRTLLEGKLVRLEYDGDRKDQYNRTLAYVVLDDGTTANEAIIRAGWAEAYRRFVYRRKADFQAAEREARAARRGMWAARK